MSKEKKSTPNKRDKSSTSKNQSKISLKTQNKHTTQQSSDDQNNINVKPINNNIGDNPIKSLSNYSHSKPQIFSGGDFAELVTKSTTFVDKTLFIKEIIESPDKVTLITMPRRWGKSLNLNMLKRFLSVEEQDQKQKELNKQIFTSKKAKLLPDGNKTTLDITNADILVIDEKDIFDTEKLVKASDLQGTFPVIFIDFKDCKGSNFDDVVKDLQKRSSDTVKQFAYLQDINTKYNVSTIGNEYKSLLNNINSGNFKDSLKDLSALLYAHHNKKVWILVDEYDAVTNNAFNNFGKLEYSPTEKKFREDGQFKKLNTLLSSIMGSALKGNDSLEKAIVTGILRISKNDMLSTINNLKEHNLMSSTYSKYYGFSANEINDLCKILHLDNSQIEGLDSMANGYQYGNNNKNKTFNTWSAVNFLNNVLKGETVNDDTWTSSGGLNLVKNIITSNNIQPQLQALHKGESIEIDLKHHISYESLLLEDTDSAITTVFNILLWTGYLTPDSILDSKTPKLLVKIPNKPVRDVFTEQIIEWASERFNLQQLTSDFTNIIHSIDTDTQNNFEESLNTFISNLKDELITAKNNSKISKFNEHTLHDIIYVVCLRSNQSEELISDYNFGKSGRTDIAFKAKNLGLILELKYNKSPKDALNQIHQQKYYTGFNDDNHIKKILAVGINLSCKNNNIDKLDSDWHCYKRNEKEEFTKRNKEDFFIKVSVLKENNIDSPIGEGNKTLHKKNKKKSEIKDLEPSVNKTILQKLEDSQYSQQAEEINKYLTNKFQDINNVSQNSFVNQWINDKDHPGGIGKAGAKILYEILKPDLNTGDTSDEIQNKIVQKSKKKGGLIDEYNQEKIGGISYDTEEFETILHQRIKDERIESIKVLNTYKSYAEYNKSEEGSRLLLEAINKVLNETDTVLLPYAEEDHFIGIVLKKTNDGILMQYMNSDELNETDYIDFKKFRENFKDYLIGQGIILDCKKIEVNQQKYSDNCGIETIENFIGYLKGEDLKNRSITQDGSILLHKTFKKPDTTENDVSDNVQLDNKHVTNTDISCSKIKFGKRKYSELKKMYDLKDDDSFNISLKKFKLKGISELDGMTQKEVEANLLSIIENYKATSSESNRLIADQVLDSQQVLLSLENWCNYSRFKHYSAIVKVENSLDHKHAILLTALKTNSQSIVVTITDPLSEDNSMFKAEIEQLAQLLSNQDITTNVVYSGIQDKDYGTCADLSLIMLQELLEKIHSFQNAIVPDQNLHDHQDAIFTHHENNQLPDFYTHVELTGVISET